MRFTTDTDWTMITGANCTECDTQAYNSSTSTTHKNGTYWKPEHIQSDMKYAGATIKDTMCVSGNDKTCIQDFEFFVITNQTEGTRSSLQSTDGVVGLAPDMADNGPSFLKSLLDLKIIDKLEVGVRM